MAIVAGLQPAMLARLSTCYLSAASFEIGKKFSLDENELLSPLIVVPKYFLFVFIVLSLGRRGGWGSMHESRGP